MNSDESACKTFFLLYFDSALQVKSKMQGIGPSEPTPGFESDQKKDKNTVDLSRNRYNCELKDEKKKVEQRLARRANSNKR